MSDEPQPQSGRAGMIFVVLALASSAIGVAGWYLNSNRGPGFDTSGFDMSTGELSAQAPASQAGAPAPAAEAPKTSLGMSMADESMVVAGGALKPVAAGAAASDAANSSDPKQAAVLAFQDSAIKNEKSVSAYIRRMEAKHPSITQYGKDWAASPELSALRDQYWKDRNPLTFAYGLAKSGDFKKLLKKYANDPGVRDVILSGFKEVPGDLVAATGRLTQHDTVVNDLATTVIGSAGLPPSVATMLGSGADAKLSDQNKVISEALNSEQAKKALNAR